MKIKFASALIAATLLTACGPQKGPTQTAEDYVQPPERPSHAFPSHHPMSPSGMRMAQPNHRYSDCDTRMGSDRFNRDSEQCLSPIGRDSYGSQTD